MQLHKTTSIGNFSSSASVYDIAPRLGSNFTAGAARKYTVHLLIRDGLICYKISKIA